MLLYLQWWAGSFNSHPHKEDDLWHIIWTVSVHPFNSHPHKEDDRESISNRSPAFLSTHILTRRMTEMSRLCGCIEILSTHILTRRMTNFLSSVFYI